MSRRQAALQGVQSDAVDAGGRTPEHLEPEKKFQSISKSAHTEGVEALWRLASTAVARNLLD